MIYWRNVSQQGLAPWFLSEVTNLLSSSSYHWYVTSAFRSIADQTILYEKHLAGGPLAAPPGKSAHNFGLAIDVALDGDPDKPGLQMTWNTKLAGWLWLKQACYRHPKLQNGWSFGDWPHIQAYQWKRYI